MRDTRLDRSALVWGSLFTVVGATFLLQELGVWRVSAEVLLPVLLIVAGVVLLGSGLSRGDAAHEQRAPAEPAPAEPSPAGPTPEDPTAEDREGRVAAGRPSGYEEVGAVDDRRGGTSP